MHLPRKRNYAQIDHILRNLLRFLPPTKLALSPSWRDEVELPWKLILRATFFTTSGVEFKFYAPPSFKRRPSTHPLAHTLHSRFPQRIKIFHSKKRPTFNDSCRNIIPSLVFYGENTFSLSRLRPRIGGEGMFVLWRRRRWRVLIVSKMVASRCLNLLHEFRNHFEGRVIVSTVA